MTFKTNPAAVDTSFSIFFLVYTTVFSLLLSFVFGNYSGSALISIIGYVVITYAVWDIIRQLYSPGQALFLYVVTFIILPVAMNWLLVYPFGMIGIIIFVSASIAAALSEFIYEKYAKKIAPQPIMKRLLAADASIDKSIIKLSNQHIFTPLYRGLVIALLIMVAYFTLTYLLLHKY